MELYATIAVVLACAGINFATWEGNILDKAESKLPNWLYRPLLGCIPCMSFWYTLGTVIVYNFVYRSKSFEWVAETYWYYPFVAMGIGLFADLLVYGRNTD